MKRIIALLMIMILSCGILAGCTKAAQEAENCIDPTLVPEKEYYIEDLTQKGNGDENVNSEAKTLKTDAMKAATALLTKFVKSSPEYPETALYPNYEDYVGTNGNVDNSAYQKAEEDYFRTRQAIFTAGEGAVIPDNYNSAMIGEFLANSGDENVTFSPVNIYMALAMLAEVTDGTSREQILNLLGASNIEALRNNSKAVWNSAFSDNGLLTSVLGASAWLRNDMEYNEETLKTLAKYYYASVFAGEMGTTDYDAALQTWLNAQTGGLLEDAVQGVSMDPKTVLTIATTVLFTGKWMDTFSEGQTFDQTFHGAKEDANVPFMHSDNHSPVYGNDKFTATYKSFDEGGAMYLILPDEGISVAELLKDEETLAFINNITDYEKYWTMTKNVHLSLPKFDISSDINLIKGMQNLGITDIFDSATADFSPLTDSEDIVLTGGSHAARVMIDEEGCKAAAFTIFYCGTTAFIEYDDVDMTLDRPFVYVITDRNGDLLFIGVVNQLEK